MMRHLTLPLLHFTNRVRSMTRKEQDRSPIQLKTRDEIGVLAGAFNHLLEETEGRKRALQDNLLFHQVLFDTLPIPVYIKNTAGNYLGCNTAFENFSGRQREELIGRTAEDVGIRPPGGTFPSVRCRSFRGKAVQIYETRSGARQRPRARSHRVQSPLLNSQTARRPA